MSLRGRLSRCLCFALLAAGGVPLAAQEEPTAPPPQVTVARPVEREVADTQDFKGRVEASQEVELRARVTGYLTAVLFKDGSQVRQGDVLFEIDSRPYQAELSQAQSQVDVAKAKLQVARAALARDQALAKKAPGAVSQEQLDQDQAAFDEAAARVGASAAAAERYRLDLSFCRVIAPIDGRIGRRLLDPGNLVTQDVTPLAVLVSDAPVYVSLDVDERTLLRLRRSKQDGAGLTFAVGLADEEGHPRSATVDFVDNRLDPEKETIRMRGVLANKDGLLTPGLSVRSRLTLGPPIKALLIDRRAARIDDSEMYVYVVDREDKLVRRKLRRLGPCQDDGLCAVIGDVTAQDRVVVGELSWRHRPGMKVKPVEGDAAAPKPREPTDDSSPRRRDSD